MGPNGIAATDGGMETVLIFDYGLELPCFAAFPLLEDERGQDTLRRYFEPFIAIADQRNLRFVLDTATWRANPDWGERLGYDLDGLAGVNRRAVAFAKQLAAGRPGMTINGVIGPRGDGYVVGERMTSEAAADYHSWQIGILAEAGVDRITALTLTYPEEAIGIVRSAAEAGVAVVASFTVETDGHLPDGTSVQQAVRRVDAETDQAAEFLMLNCAHPTHIAAIGRVPELERIGGLRVNASASSHAELDESEQLEDSDPSALARDHAALRQMFGSIELLGGCCGTDHRHVAQIIDAWHEVSASSPTA
jgi:homocysteine S-methyltransferase